jgi:ABC-type nitrate/sulfonate/bicarbonate transport system substrate-binding protein
MSRIVFHLLLLFVCLAAPRESTAQPSAKKVRLGIQSNNIGFLPFHLAYHKGFYREQGIELETIFMATQAVNAAFVRGDIDYSAQSTGHPDRAAIGEDTRCRCRPAVDFTHRAKRSARRKT